MAFSALKVIVSGTGACEGDNIIMAFITAEHKKAPYHRDTELSIYTLFTDLLRFSSVEPR